MFKYVNISEKLEETELPSKKRVYGKLNLKSCFNIIRSHHASFDKDNYCVP